MDGKRIIEELEHRLKRDIEISNKFIKEQEEDKHDSSFFRGVIWQTESTLKFIDGLKDIL